MLASGTQDRGFAPGRSRRIFRAKKSSACLPSESRLPHVADLRHVKEPYNLPDISRLLPFLANRRLWCRLTRSASGDDGRN
jgi:hypothetical protein